MRKSLGTAVWLAVLAGIGALLAVGHWQAHSSSPIRYKLDADPEGIMGTTSRLRAVIPAGKRQKGKAAMSAAEQILRDVEAHMSPYLEASEVSQINAACAGEIVELSPQTLAVLSLAREYHRSSERTFDVTSAPVFNLWRECAKANRLPTEAEIEAAREASGWQQFHLTDYNVQKLLGEARIDLGGLAKGYGIDRASEALMAAGATGGLVEVGGDIRCFGKRYDGKPWTIVIANPFKGSGLTEPIGTLNLQDKAVCTSGNYERFYTIDGRRYSHIVDPLTGQALPADSDTDAKPVVSSVTVVAPTAAEADAWATALTVLATRRGPKQALEMIGPDTGVEAMLVIGTPKSHSLEKTPGFDALLKAKDAALAPASGPANGA